MTVLILVETDRGVVTEAGREALTAGRRLAADLDTAVEAVIPAGSGDGSDDLVDAAVADVAGHGAAVVHVARHRHLADYGPDAWADTVAQLADATDAEVVAATGTDRGNEVLAHVAARADLPFVANCLSVAAQDDGWSITRVQWGGSLLEDVTLTADRALVTFAHHATPAEPIDPAADPVAVDVEAFEPDLDDDVATTLVQGRDVESQGVTLATAPVVVGGGRGVGSADGFGPLEELAALIEGVVGCSRAVTNNGWRPHTDQVGQTGTRIAPDLYIAAGISGAIQHWVGAMASKRILAINTDPEANMVTRADYAVIADLHALVPAICDEIRRRRS